MSEIIYNHDEAKLEHEILVYQLESEILTVFNRDLINIIESSTSSNNSFADKVKAFFQMIWKQIKKFLDFIERMVRKVLVRLGVSDKKVTSTTLIKVPDGWIKRVQNEPIIINKVKPTRTYDLSMSEEQSEKLKDLLNIEVEARKDLKQENQVRESVMANLSSINEIVRLLTVARETMVYNVRYSTKMLTAHKFAAPVTTYDGWDDIVTIIDGLDRPVTRLFATEMRAAIAVINKTVDFGHLYKKFNSKVELLTDSSKSLHDQKHMNEVNQILESARVSATNMSSDIIRFTSILDKCFKI